MYIVMHENTELTFRQESRYNLEFVNILNFDKAWALWINTVSEWFSVWQD